MIDLGVVEIFQRQMKEKYLNVRPVNRILRVLGYMWPLKMYVQHLKQKPNIDSKSAPVNIRMACLGRSIQ